MGLAISGSEGAIIIFMNYVKTKVENEEYKFLLENMTKLARQRSSPGYRELIYLKNVEKK